MSPVQFSFWPWKVLAVAVPVVALAAGAIAAHEGGNGIEVCALVLGVTDAYVLAIATGHFGRSILALPFAAAATYGSLLAALHAPAVCVIFLLSMVIAHIEVAMICFPHTRQVPMPETLPRSLQSNQVMDALASLMLLVATGAALNGSKELTPFIGFPLSLGFACALLPQQRGVAAVISAFLIGARAGLHGLLDGVLFFLALVLLSVPFGSGFTYAGVLVAGCVANYFALRSLFRDLTKRDSADASGGFGAPEP